MYKTEELKACMALCRNPLGIAIASNQTEDAKEPWIMMNYPANKFYFYYKPEVLEVDGKPKEFEEECLTLPGEKHKVKRYPRITISYETREGKREEREFMGYQAQIVQHEMDHLNNKLINGETREDHRIK